MRAGRSLESLLSAYRIGARVAWRRFAAVGVAAGLEPETLYLLAESIFAYIDVLSAESAEGHALEQSAVAGEAELRRRRLARMLVREQPAEVSVVRAAANEARWPLPRKVAVLAVTGPRREPVASHLGVEAISDTIGETLVAVIPDPDGPGRRAAVERAVREAGATAGLGTTVAWGNAAVSFARATAALALADGSPALIVASEQAGRLLLRSDRSLAEELATERLAPLAELSPRQRARMVDTLRAWLAEQGRLSAVADAAGRSSPDRSLPARAAARAVRRGARRPRRAVLARARPARGRRLGGGLGLGFRLGLGLGEPDLGAERPGHELVVPDVADRDLEAP